MNGALLYTSGRKKVAFAFIFFFFGLVAFGSVKQNSQCSPRKTKEFFYILKTYLKTPPTHTPAGLCVLLLQMFFGLTFTGGSSAYSRCWGWCVPVMISELGQHPAALKPKATDN